MNTEGYINIYLYLVVISVFADNLLYLGFAAEMKNRFAEKKISQKFFAFFSFRSLEKMGKFGIKKQTFCENSFKRTKYSFNINFLTDLLQFLIGKPGTRECITLAVKLPQNGKNFAKK